MTRDSVGFTFDASGEGEYGYWGDLAPGRLPDGRGGVAREPVQHRLGRRLAGCDGGDREWLVGEMFFPWSQMAMPHASGARRFGVFASRQFAAAGERWRFRPSP